MLLVYFQIFLLLHHRFKMAVKENRMTFIKNTEKTTKKPDK